MGALNAVPGLPVGLWMMRGYFKAARVPQFPLDKLKEMEYELCGPNAWMNVYGLMSMSKLRFFSPEMWERLQGNNPVRDLGLNRERMRKWHPLHRSLLIGARVMLPGMLLSSKGDRVAMNSSVETRYPFLDEDVFAFLAKLHPRWKLRGLRDKYLLRLLAERYLPHSIAWRRKAMFRAPMNTFNLDDRSANGAWVSPLLTDEALRRTGYFNIAEVRRWRRDSGRLRHGSVKRTSIEMGLVGVTATQLWHHTYVEPLGDLQGAATRKSKSNREHLAGRT
jgi:asparagine synthase (glutamine-hydrolysing)